MKKDTRRWTMLLADSEARILVQGIAVATWIRLAFAAPLLLAQAAVAGDGTSKAPTESKPAEQELKLDLTIDYYALSANQPGDRGRDAPGNFGTTRNLPPRVNWSRRVGKSWNLDPVLLHRRQAGQPTKREDDLSNKSIGIELRRQF